VHAAGVDVEWSVELEKLRPIADGAEVRLRHADGTVEELTTPWLIGADGAHSAVRKQLGMNLVGDSSETWLVADAVVEAELPRDSLHWMHLAKGTIMLVPFPAEGKWRLLDTEDTDSADRPDVVAARFAAKISEGLGKQVVVRTPSWVSTFTIRQRLVENMRSGRCFLAGDAAHVHSPASGQGMNTGIQDAHNLAWKLAEVIRGDATAELLDTFTAERVPVGEALLGSTKTATGLIALRNAAAPVLLPVGLAVLNVVKPVKRSVERKILKGMSGLALDYAVSPLTVAHAGARAGIEPGDRVGCSAAAERESAGWRAMCAELADPRWTLLVFEPDCAAFPALKELDERYQSVVSLRSVSATDEAGGPNPLEDPGSVLASSFGLGAVSGGFALVRPDGYLSAKGPALDRLAGVLDAVHLVGKPA
jgi:NADPH-dependent dioxygenase